MINELLDVQNCLHVCTHVRMHVACEAVMVSLMAVDYSAMGVDTVSEFEPESDAEGRVCECVWLCCARVQYDHLRNVTESCRELTFVC